ncbi:MAG: hypothetical protein NTZ75_04910 [Euryarchaeota archaeon]|nr:hypothetical protein [Euryarchaeota archaeon]
MRTIFLLVFTGYYRDCFDDRRDDFQLTDLGFVRFSTCEFPGFSIDLVGLCAGAVGYYAYLYRRVHDVGYKKNYHLYCSTSSLVETTVMRDCFFRATSFDQRMQWSLNDNAKKSISSGSGDTSLASERNDAYSSFFTKFTTVCKNFMIRENCIVDKENFSIISSLCSPSSSSANDGAYNSNEGSV